MVPIPPEGVARPPAEVPAVESGAAEPEGQPAPVLDPQQALVEELEATQLFSEELGIDLASGEEEELFKWFLASLLLGSSVGHRVAVQTYQAMVRYKLLSPCRVAAAGWAFLVDPVMAAGGYTQDDGHEATLLLRACEALRAEYGGSLLRLHEASTGPWDLEQRLKRLDGIGALAVNLFLRELRPHWGNADPGPLSSVTDVAWKVGIDLNAYDRSSVPFVRLEAGLVRRRQELLGTRRIRRRTCRATTQVAGSDDRAAPPERS